MLKLIRTIAMFLALAVAAWLYLWLTQLTGRWHSPRSILDLLGVIAGSWALGFLLLASAMLPASLKKARPASGKPQQ